jgi:phenylpyruvate tautomerase PptA (4-oxalocrotonate tautomerase family)
MPTYTVSHSGIDLAADRKNRIAQSITRTHHATTGANTFFAQVIFVEIPQGNHFIGGKPVTEPQLFLHGQIRAGRTPEVKEKLIAGLMDALAGETGLDKSRLWVYLVDLVPSQMIEYGEILPSSGKESEWFSRLPADLRTKLAALE